LRTRGSHRSYKHPPVDEVLTIQPKEGRATYKCDAFSLWMREYDLSRTIDSSLVTS
jgi:hypothetical protein